MALVEEKKEGENVVERVKELAKMTVMTFYGAKEQLVFNVIAREKVATLKKLASLLKFDGIIECLDKMNKEKLIKFKLVGKIGFDEKRYGIRHYSVNYGQLVNIVKFKLSSVRTKCLEEERGEYRIQKAWFCQTCRQSFSGGELVYRNTYRRCPSCKKQVIKIQSKLPSLNNPVACFDLEASPFYELIERIEKAI